MAVQGRLGGMTTALQPVTDWSAPVRLSRSELEEVAAGPRSGSRLLARRPSAGQDCVVGTRVPGSLVPDIHTLFKGEEIAGGQRGEQREDREQRELGE